MGHYDDQREYYDAPLREQRAKEQAEFRKKAIDFFHTELQKRSLDTILADILLDPEKLKQNIK